MIFSLHDIILILSIFVQIPLIGVLWFKGRHLISNQLMAFFFFAQILNSLDSLGWSHFNLIYGAYPYLVYIGIPFYTIWGPTLYLYIKSETTSGFHFKPVYILHYLPFILLTSYFLFFFHFHSIEEKRLLIESREVYNFSLDGGHSIFISVQVFIYNLWSIVTLERFAKRNRLKSSTLLSRINWNRFIIYGYFIACICNNVAKILYLSSGIKEISSYFYISSILFLLYFTVILIGALLSSPFGNQIKNVGTLKLTKDECDIVRDKLESYMNIKRPFLQFNLTLAELASNLGFKERELSQFINMYYHTSFQDYINGYRITEAKKLIELSKNSNKTILEIVYESGFNSKSAFNFAFKKHTTITPTQYKKMYYQ